MLEDYIRGNVGVFIDESNLFHTQQTLQFKIDFKKLFSYLGSFSMTENMIYIYICYIPTNWRQKKFIKKLRKYGYNVVTREMKYIQTKDGGLIQKGNLDIELALDAFRFSEKYDNLLLFSGDSDFAYLVDLLKEKGKTSITISSRRHVSIELLQCSKYFNINKLRHIIEWTPNVKGPHEAAPEDLRR